MKALIAHQYGPPEQLELGDLPVPHAGPGQIQVRIATASINPLDLRLPRGDFAQLPVTFPHVPGNDFAGTVTEVGAGVTGYQEGDEVFGHAVPHALRAMAGAEKPSLTTGTLAEYAVFEADTPFIAHRPGTLDIVQAAALPTVGITALALMKTAQVQPHETVLVIGATGGVGTTVLPLIQGTVIATGKPADAELLRKRGAAEVIDYGDYPKDVDVALNLVLPSDQLNDVANALKPGGRLFTITFPMPQPGFIDRDDVRFELVLDMDGKLAGMREVAEAGLVATIGRRYPFEQAGQAIADFANRHTTGKLVVLVR
ncbi:NADPH:quinone reductase-like Zn-dependent oxidoreductase [Actinoplanes tereljensis]|uniref:NADPH:quinone reductase n=1 Tax=Paractinoplanes tereljensis TaxID=571912 RepID=A0A919U0F9_9ACTN|nr:NADP-dependent oxidoreductase [Actinoplanes tereljensis]GIF26842.1 NADPH:quinone reductase [Actinoplanes tereljensis]